MSLKRNLGVFATLFIVALFLFISKNMTTIRADFGCPCTLWGNAVPGTPSNLTDTTSVNLGMAFSATTDGTITGMRFYKGPTNTGTHTGYLWTSTGTLLAQVTFTGETASGWQSATFASPISITANTTYVVSYFAPNGNYAVDRNVFASGVSVPPLYALSNAENPNGNGMYDYGAQGTFPANNFQETNYYIDVTFQDTPVSPTPTPSPTPVVTTKTYTVTDNSRDASVEKIGTNQYDVRISGFDSITEPYDFVSTDSDDESSGIQFPLDIPSNATITNAYITFTAAPLQGTSSTGGMHIYLNDLDSLPPYTDQVISGGITTLHPVYASPLLWTAGTSWGSGAAKTTPDLSSFIQTFINRAGYTSGNYIGFAFTGGTLPGGKYYGWNDFTAGNPGVLTVSYTLPATPTPTPSPTSAPSSTTQETSTPHSEVCTMSAPGKTLPHIYAAIPQSTTSIVLYFSSSGDPLTHYDLQFGTKPGTYTYGALNIGGHDARTYLVQSLSPHSTYYFRVRGANGCTSGDWSNEFSAQTLSPTQNYSSVDTSSNLFSQAEVTPKPTATPKQTPSSLRTSSPSPQPTPRQQEKSYELNVKVTDTEKKAVAGAKVTLHSKIQETVTDEHGIAHFAMVEPGEHHVTIAYAGYEGTQAVELTGDVKEFTIAMTIAPQSLWKDIPLIIVSALSITIVVILLFIIWKLKKERNEKL